MILSNTTEYAIRLLVYMATDPEKKYTAKCLVDKLGISDKYLRRILTTLAKDGFIRSIQGINGGYIFNKPIEDIYLYDIIDKIEGIEKYTSCILGFGQCSDEHPCALHDKWSKIRFEMIEMFKTTNLAEIVSKHHDFKI